MTEPASTQPPKPPEPKPFEWLYNNGRDAAFGVCLKCGSVVVRAGDPLDLHLRWHDEIAKHGTVGS